MEDKQLTAEYNGIIGKIEADEPAGGAYLYIFLPDGAQYDYLQNTLLDCQEFALEEFGIPVHCWQNAAHLV
jgi:hypothetical protein